MKTAQEILDKHFPGSNNDIIEAMEEYASQYWQTDGVEPRPVHFDAKISIYSKRLDAPQTFHTIEITPMCRIREEGISPEPVWDECNPEQAELWWVDLHYENGHTECIADCDTEETANKLADLIRWAATNYISKL